MVNPLVALSGLAVLFGVPLVNDTAKEYLRRGINYILEKTAECLCPLSAMDEIQLINTAIASITDQASDIEKQALKLKEEAFKKRESLEIKLEKMKDQRSSNDNNLETEFNNAKKEYNKADALVGFISSTISYLDRSKAEITRIASSDSNADHPSRILLKAILAEINTAKETAARRSMEVEAIKKQAAEDIEKAKEAESAADSDEAMLAVNKKMLEAKKDHQNALLVEEIIQHLAIQAGKAANGIERAIPVLSMSINEDRQLHGRNIELIKSRISASFSVSDSPFKKVLHEIEEKHELMVAAKDKYTLLKEKCKISPSDENEHEKNIAKHELKHARNVLSEALEWSSKMGKIDFGSSVDDSPMPNPHAKSVGISTEVEETKNDDVTDGIALTSFSSKKQYQVIKGQERFSLDFLKGMRYEPERTLGRVVDEDDAISFSSADDASLRLSNDSMSHQEENAAALSQASITLALGNVNMQVDDHSA